MALDYLLMGAQAAGLVTDMWSQSMGYRTLKRGQQLDEQQLELRIKEDRLASMEQSIFSLETLAETLATQRALMSVRGGLPGIGSNLALEQKSVTAFNKDEQARALNLGFMEMQRRSQISASRMALAGEKGKMGASLFGKAFGMIPFSEIGQKLSPAKGAPKFSLNKASGFKPMKQFNWKDTSFLLGKKG